MEEFGYLASIGLFGEGFRIWETTARALEKRLGEMPALHGGVSQMSRGGCLVRFFAALASDLTYAVGSLWGLVRQLLFGLPPLDLRKL
jgi:hypothetical protein